MKMKRWKICERRRSQSSGESTTKSRKVAVSIPRLNVCLPSRPPARPTPVVRQFAMMRHQLPIKSRPSFARARSAAVSYTDERPRELHPSPSLCKTAEYSDEKLPPAPRHPREEPSERGAIP